MPKVGITLYDKKGLMAARQTEVAGSLGDALMNATTYGERTEATKIVIERVRSEMMLSLKDRDAVAVLLRKYREGDAVAPNREKLDHWIKRLEED